MILFKYPEKAREFASLDIRVVRIVQIIEAIYWWKWMEPIVITEVFRNDTQSPHKYWRAVDIAIPAKAGEAGANLVRAVINQLFPYGVAGYETVPDIEHGDSPHLHCQVPPTVGTGTK